LIAIFGVWKGDAQVFNSLVTTEGEISFSAAILATLFAYDGWILVGSIAGEVKNSAKVLPKAITAGLLLVTSVYLIINIAILQVLPAAEVVRLGDNAASHVSEILFGNIGGKILSIGILVSIFGTLNAKIMTYPRVPYAMALRGQLPFSKQLSQVSVRWSTPIVAILSTVGLSILYMMVGDPNKLTDICMFTIVFFYILAFLAVFRLRRVQPNMEGNYRVPLYPWVPGIAILGSAFILIETAIQQTDYAIFSVLLTIIGLPIFWFLQKKKNSSTASISTN
jgi:APA family basic amino acid/polyamine antiporter